MTDLWRHIKLFLKTSRQFALKSHISRLEISRRDCGVSEGNRTKHRFQTLLGATGTGKTFTVANVVQQIQKPTLVIAHNKTLAAQLCNEFQAPDNAVEYFVSYYDYYQPEAYMPGSDTYRKRSDDQRRNRSFIMQPRKRFSPAKTF